MSQKIKLLGVFFASLALCVSQAHAVDFGKMAATFEIIEEGFVAMMHRRLKEVDFSKENEKMQRIATDRVQNPKPVAFIKNADETKTFYFDPTITMLEDIFLPNGNVLIKAGTRVNPLDHMNLGRRLFFLDGRNKDQIEWCKNKLSELKAEEDKNAINQKALEQEIIQNKVILTGGKIFEIQKELGIEVYFDQSGELTSRFGIRAVPSIAEQEDKKIKITEIDIQENTEISRRANNNDSNL